MGSLCCCPHCDDFEAPDEAGDAAELLGSRRQLPYRRFFHRHCLCFCLCFQWLLLNFRRRSSRLASPSSSAPAAAGSAHPSLAVSEPPSSGWSSSAAISAAAATHASSRILSSPSSSNSSSSSGSSTTHPAEMVASSSGSSSAGLLLRSTQGSTQGVAAPAARSRPLGVPGEEEEEGEEGERGSLRHSEAKRLLPQPPAPSAAPSSFSLEQQRQQQQQEQGGRQQQRQPLHGAGTEARFSSSLPERRTAEAAAAAVESRLARVPSALSLSDEECCPTCLEGYEEENPQITLRCGHGYHLACIYEWMERSNKCPICMKVMEFDEL